MNSIYHFFKAIYFQREALPSCNALEKFSSPNNLLSFVNNGTFPNLALKLNTKRDVFNGVELIELKDCDGYTVFLSKMKKVFTAKELKSFRAFDIKHHFNGYFRVYQTAIK